MGCKGCSRKRTRNLEVDTTAEARDYLRRTPNSYRIVGTDRKWYSISAPLVTKKPLGHGWTVSVLIDGRGVRVSGRNAITVVDRVSQLYRDNGISADKQVVWYNCNLHWLNKSRPQDRRCSYEDLLTLSESPEDNVRDPFLPYYWYDKAFGFIGTFLSQDNYSYDGFMMIMSILKDMLKDEYTGCDDCYDLLTDRLIEFKPLNTRDQARDWLIEYINTTRESDGKAALTTDQISRMHKWS